MVVGSELHELDLTRSLYCFSRVHKQATKVMYHFVLLVPIVIFYRKSKSRCQVLNLTRVRSWLVCTWLGEKN